MPIGFAWNLGRPDVVLFVAADRKLTQVARADRPAVQRPLTSFLWRIYLVLMAICHGYRTCPEGGKCWGGSLSEVVACTSG